MIKSYSPVSANFSNASFASDSAFLGSYSLNLIPNSAFAFSNPWNTASLNDLSPFPPVE